MSTRREFIQYAALGAGLVASPTVVATERGAAVAASSAAVVRKSVPRVKSIVRREDTVVRYGGSGDNWHLTWASDDRQYMSLCDGNGFTDDLSRFHNTRMLSVTGGPQSARVIDLPGYPELARPKQKKSDPRYYGYGTIALGPKLYQFLSTFNRSFRADELERPDANDLMRFNGVKLIYSADRGRTWANQDGSMPVIWEQWDQRTRDNLVFLNEDQEAFSLLSVLQMGRDYAENRDGYVYVYAPNGNTDGTMNELVMFRVPKEQILDRGCYEYFAGRSVNNNARWVKDIESRAVVHVFPRGWVNRLEHPYAWQPSIVYNASLQMYLMTSWGTGYDAGGMWFNKPSYLGFWMAQRPWGPWIQIHEETSWTPDNDPEARAYQPQISPKWIAPDGKSFWLVWSDFKGHDSLGMKQFTQDQKNRHRDAAVAYTEDEVREKAIAMRKFMPRYAFNIQRVEIVVT